MHRYLPFLAVLTVFFIITYFRLGHVLWDPSTIAVPGDGLGTMGWIYDMHEHVRRNGFLSIFSGTYVSETIGAGLNLYGLPSSWLQRLTYFTLGSIFGDKDAFDALAALTLILIGSTGYLLGREAGVNRFCSLLLGVALLGLPSFNLKIGSHIFLANYYTAILCCWAALRYGTKSTLTNLSILLICMLTNFLVCEYYGYYGLFVALALVLTSYGLLRSKTLPAKVFAGHTAFALLGFTFLMGLSFPQLLSGFFSSVLGTKAGIMENFTRLEYEYQLHAMYQPQSIFSPNLEFIRYFFGSLSHLSQGSEYIYRIGFLIPVTILLTALFCLKNIKKSHNQRHLLYFLLILTVGAGVAYCFALRPEHPLSLVPLTKTIAPMFRVSVRAVIYVQILFMLGFALIISNIVSQIPRHNKLIFNIAGKIAGIVAAAALFGAGFADLRDFKNTRMFSSIPSRNIPSWTGYEKLAKLPDGYLLEIPFLVPGYDAPEGDTEYYIGRMMHGKPMVNGGMPFNGPLGASVVRMGLIGRFNTAEPAFVKSVQKLGIRYVSVHRKPNIDFENFQKLEGLRLVVDEKDHKIFEVQNRSEFSLSKLKRWVWTDDFTILSYTLTSNEKFTKDIVSADADQNIRVIEKKVSGPSFLMYGPYIPLSPGKYNVTLELGFEPKNRYKPTDEIFNMDIVSDKEGGVAGMSIPFERFNNIKTRVSKVFTLKKTGVIQVRLRAAHEGRYTHGNLNFKRTIHKESFVLAQLPEGNHKRK